MPLISLVLLATYVFAVLVVAASLLSGSLGWKTNKHISHLPRPSLFSNSPILVGNKQRFIIDVRDDLTHQLPYGTTRSASARRDLIRAFSSTDGSANLSGKNLLPASTPFSSSSPPGPSPDYNYPEGYDELDANYENVSFDLSDSNDGTTSDSSTSSTSSSSDPLLLAPRPRKSMYSDYSSYLSKAFNSTTAAGTSLISSLSPLQFVGSTVSKQSASDNDNATVTSSQIDSLSISPSATSPFSFSLPSASSTSTSRELAAIKSRLDKLEKSISTGLLVSSPSSLYKAKTTTAVGGWIDSLGGLAANTITINPQVVEWCSTAGFFFIGALIGASMLDRLWLLGGIAMAYWASGAVHRDTRGGMIARKVGVQMARVIRDLQERYTQMMVFYRTGKLAYVSLGAWETIDSKFAVTTKMNGLKRLAMMRATEFNTAFKETKLSDQVTDVLKVIGQAPGEAQRIDKKYGVTAKIIAFGRGVVSSTSDGLKELVQRGSGTDGSSSNSGGKNSWKRGTERGWKDGGMGWITADRNTNSRARKYSSNNGLSSFSSRRGENGQFKPANFNSGFWGFSFWGRNDRHTNKKNENLNLSGIISFWRKPKSFDKYRGRVINPWAPPLSKTQVVSKKNGSNNQGWKIFGFQ